MTELTAKEKLALSMTDETIANAIDEELESIMQLIIANKTELIAFHVGAISSWSSVLRTRHKYMPKEL